jgi:GNAT superfamily N-acetyltransferase
MSDRAPLRYRRGGQPDLRETLEVMVRATRDLHRSRGMPPSDGPEPARALAFRCHALRHDPDGFWVAEDGDHVAGFGIAVVRGGAWYLAALHVLPEYQGLGVGRELLRRCLATAPASDRRFTLSEAVNEVSNGLYARSGMVPHAALLGLEGPAAANRAVTAVSCRALDAGVAATALDELDRDVLGMARPVDHAFWRSLDGVVAYLLEHEGRASGYAYVSADGAVGPAAFAPGVDPVAVAATLLRCVGEAGAERARLRVFGQARVLIESLLGAGFRLQPGIGLLLATEPLGRLDRYLASSDALL